jgi:hypothetical protein
VVSAALLLTAPDHRYFLLAFPAFALAGARGLRRLPEPLAERALVLATLFAAGALYLFVDWERASHVFTR